MTTTPTPGGRPLRGLLETDPVVATAGVSLLADALRDQAVPVTETRWQPPMDGTETDLARSHSSGGPPPTPWPSSG